MFGEVKSRIIHVTQTRTSTREYCTYLYGTSEWVIVLFPVRVFVYFVVHRCCFACIGKSVVYLSISPCTRDCKKYNKPFFALHRVIVVFRTYVRKATKIIPKNISTATLTHQVCEQCCRVVEHRPQTAVGRTGVGLRLGYTVARIGAGMESQTVPVDGITWWRFDVWPATGQCGPHESAARFADIAKGGAVKRTRLDAAHRSDQVGGLGVGGWVAISCL